MVNNPHPPKINNNNNPTTLLLDNANTQNRNKPLILNDQPVNFVGHVKGRRRRRRRTTTTTTTTTTATTKPEEQEARNTHV